MENVEKIKLLNEIEKLRIRNQELEKISNKSTNSSGTLLQRKVLSRALLNIPTDAVMLVDKDCIIIDVNETTARRFVTFIENIIGTPLENLFSKTTSAKICSYIKRVFDTMQPWRFEDEKLGVWSDVVFYPIFNEEQKVENIAVVSRDISNLKEVQRKLGQSNEKNEALLQAIPDPVVRCTRNGVIQNMENSNANFPIALDKKIIGKPIFNILPSKYIHAFIFNIEKSFQTKKVQISEIKIEKDNVYRYVEARIVSELSGGFVVIFRDISEQKNIEEKLILAKEKAEKADELKSNFLAQMSHEIRTPINAIMNHTSLLRSEFYDLADEDLKECFDSINVGGTRLIRTMDLLLNMAQLQAGEYELIKKSLNLNNIIQEVIKNHSQVAFEKKLLFEYECKTDKTVITADEYSVTQIFNNLIDNSINYTKQGKIKIRIFDDYEKLIVEIEDSGIGISEEYLPAIFEPFSQEETGYTRKFDGNGLGLSIVKHFCDLNNAEVSAVSRKGIGSIFTVAFNYNKK